MELVEKICYNMALKIGDKANKTKEEVSIINYGLFMTIHTIMAITLTIIIAFVIKKPVEMIIITFIASSLKRYSGGAHATSPNRCLVIGLIISIIFTYISIFLFNTNSTFNMSIFTLLSIFLSFITFYKNAPVGTKNKPLKKLETRQKLRKKLFVLLNIYYIIIIISSILILNGNLNLKYSIYIYCVQFGILLQSFSLTKLGEFFILQIDKFLKLYSKGD